MNLQSSVILHLIQMLSCVNVSSETNIGRSKYRKGLEDMRAEMENNVHNCVFISVQSCKQKNLCFFFFFVRISIYIYVHRGWVVCLGWSLPSCFYHGWYPVFRWITVIYCV